MIVVSDTSPINYFVLIELQNLLPKLFAVAVCPRSVPVDTRRRSGNCRRFGSAPGGSRPRSGERQRTNEALRAVVARDESEPHELGEELPRLLAKDDAREARILTHDADAGVARDKD